MANLRFRQAASEIADRHEVASLSGQPLAEEREALDCGLEVLSPDEMRRRLQSHLAEGKNRVDHVAQLYRNAQQARDEGVDLDKIVDPF